MRKKDKRNPAKFSRKSTSTRATESPGPPTGRPKRSDRAKPTVLLTSLFHPTVIRQHLAPHARVIVDPKLKRLDEADALITLLSDPITSQVLERARRLKVVGNFAVGVNNIDLKACQGRGIRVVNTPGVLTRATAELALALLLAAARRIPEGENLCRSGRFHGWAPDMLLGQELRSRRALIVGGGRIGTETGRLFRAIGLKVEFVRRADSLSSVNSKLKRAQIVSLHLPLTPDTHHWLSAERIRSLRPDCIVINTARGPVVDEKPLVRALRSRKIFAAGFDVFEEEPHIPLTLRKLPNVVLAPHIGSATEETREAMAKLVVSGVLGILGGKRPSNIVL